MSPSLHASRRRQLRLALLLPVLGLAGVLYAQLLSPPRLRDAKGGAYYPAQLHLHGSLSEGDGSMRGHNAVARDLGTVDVLWWTDHDWRIAGHGHVPGFDFNAEFQFFAVPFRDTPWNREATQTGVVWREESAEAVRLFETRLRDDVVAEGTHALELSVRSDNLAEEWQWAGIVMSATGGRLKAPIAADVEVSLRLHPLTPPSQNRRLVLRLTLSRQVEGVSELRYVVDEAGEPHQIEQVDRRIGVVPVAAPAGGWSHLVLDVTADVLKLDLGGYDNSLSEIAIGMEVRGGARAAVVVDELRVRRRRSGAEVLARAEEIAAGLEQEFDLVNHVGLELSYADHMNAYLPEIQMPDFRRFPHGLTASAAVAWVHERGGVVSYNHVFGAIPSSTEEYEERRRRLVKHRGFGADLLEVGYPHRVLALSEHLAVWDELSREGVVIGGIGTSDSHSQTQWWKDGNNYVTWVWASSPERPDLIKGLRSRRAFFGDPVRFHGELELATADGIPMGSVIRSERDEYEVVVRVSGMPAGATLRWIEQGEVIEVLTPSAGDFARSFRVDARSYRFVRAELWQGRRGLAFSNCLYFSPSRDGG